MFQLSVTMRKTPRPPVLVVALLLVVVPGGCGDGETLVPADRVLSTGTYDYEGSYLHPATGEWDLLGGALVLDVATPDSIHGRWQMTGFSSDSVGGYWNENAFVLEALSTDGVVTLTHRLWRIGTPSELACSFTFRRAEPGNEPLTTSGNCDLVHQ